MQGGTAHYLLKIYFQQDVKNPFIRRYSKKWIILLNIMPFHSFYFIVR